MHWYTTSHDGKHGFRHVRVHRLQRLALRRRRRRLARTPATPGGEDRPEAAPEVATDVVVDDRVHAAVGVREAVKEAARHFVGARLRLRREVGEEEVRVQRQPAHGEDDDDDDEDARRVLRALVQRRRRRRRRCLVTATRLDARRRVGVVVTQEAQHEEVERCDDGQRQQVGEDEERQEEAPPGRLVLDAAVVVRVLVTVARVRVQLDAVDEERRQVGHQHHGPDGADRARHLAARAPRGGAARKDDREVADDGDEHERVHRHVDRHVEQELRQLARHVAERPVVGGEVIGDKRHAHDEEEDVAEGEVQQQQVHRRAHLALRADDEYHHAVADAADDRDEAVQRRYRHLVEPEIEGHLVRAHQRRRRRRRLVESDHVHDFESVSRVRSPSHGRMSGELSGCPSGRFRTRPDSPGLAERWRRRGQIRGRSTWLGRQRQM